jgi:hypothetical protein
MPSVAMNRMMDRIRTNLPGALDATIQSELFQAADELCRQTNIWTQDFDFEIEPQSLDWRLDPDAYTHTIMPPAGSVSHRLMGAWDGNAFRINASMPQPNYVLFYGAPNSTGIYTARVALTVSDPVTRDGYPVLPDWIVNRYGDTLMQGTMGKMQLQVAKPYSSSELGMLHTQLFKQGIGRARISSERSSSYNRQNWTYPQGYSVRRY